jgi:histidinol-phosphate aminotransferase
MSGYAPGEQPPPGARVVKLNTNENPFPPSPRVLQAIRDIEAEQLRRYPSPTAECFRQAAAKVLNVRPDQIIAGNGSDDILAIAVMTFLGPGDLLATPEPTYSLYPVLAELAEVKQATVPWEKDWGLPIDALLATKARAIFLANPNAPSGTFVSPQRVEELARKFNGLVLVDEAYVDFADDNCLPLVERHENVLICRTLSKAYSLAGLRFGFGVAQESVIFEMNKARDSYPCDAISILAATAAIEDQEYAREKWEQVRAERQRVSAELTQLGWSVLPSHANFILAAVPDGRGREAYEGLKQQGILVRFFDKPGLRDKLRITIGTSQENNALLGGVKALNAADKAEEKKERERPAKAEKADKAEKLSEVTACPH